MEETIWSNDNGVNKICISDEQMTTQTELELVGDEVCSSTQLPSLARNYPARNAKGAWE
jgi:hypothetical protein